MTAPSHPAPSLRTLPSARVRCDLFCRVIDNYGDIGVCWRLARQLAVEFNWQVRLWTDDLSVLELLCPPADRPVGIEVRPWPDDFSGIAPSQVVIEAFACELPEDYLASMANMSPSPVWLNLEYLCVEDWGPGFHCQPSPHPCLPLLKHFFVPGILSGTGGILREADLTARRNRFDAIAARKQYADDISGRWIFLFCYDTPALPALLDTWASSELTIHCLVSAGKAQTQVGAWLGRPLQPGQTGKRGKLHLHALAFVAQASFDELLWTCDLNFVRGEDSFCRAQWAGRPFIWQAYPQQNAAHHDKLDSFLRHFAAPGAAASALADFSVLWNRMPGGKGSWNGNGVKMNPESGEALDPATENSGAAWAALDAALPVLETHAGKWQAHLESLGNLAEQLVRFCEKQSARTVS